MRKHLLTLAALTAVLVLGACGSMDASVGDGPDSPVDDSAGSAVPGDGSGLLAGVSGDSPFHIDVISVRVAESYPVQLFLDVEGDAPTPGHAVAYTVDVDGDRINVSITTEGGEGGSAMVLQPHSFAIPLGHAELPVTIDVNDGEFVERIDG